MKFVLTAALAAALSGTLGAQFESGAGASLRGQVNAGGPVSGLVVELYQWGGSRPIGSTDADLGGNFEFRNIPAGDYQIRLTDYAGNVIAEQNVHLMPPSSFVNIDLQSGSAQAPSGGSSGGGVVSLAELQHKAPGKAVKEFEKASKAAGKGDNEAAIAHLEKAIEIDPGYIQAYNNLGARYLRAQEYGKAAEEFRKALELDPNCQPAASNLGFTYIALQRYPEAERYARRAIDLDATSNRARFALGLALAAQNREPDEAVQNLKAAAREFPQARLALAQFFSDHGEKAQAAGELRKYLDTPDAAAEDRQKLETWLEQLESE
jgi:tetratricopeptide (TPR) repeat protein